METDPEIKELGIRGVYQLQGGIDKYFKEFPDGGYWQGKNYVFDKRFAHAPPKVDGQLYGQQDNKTTTTTLSSSIVPSIATTIRPNNHGKMRSVS
jgi:predicted sulfurtransferase